jgi:PAS domain S-box-containing protein
VNREACESLGYTRQELIGNTAVGFHLDSDRAEIESAAERAATGETVFDTHWHRRKDGSTFPVEVHTSLVSYGGRRFLLKVARDITDRLRAEEAIRQSERQLRDVIEGIPAIASTIRLDGSVEFINKRWQEYTGMSTEESVGAGWQSAGHPQDMGHYLEKRRAALASGRPFEDEARIRSRDGKYRWFLLRGAPLRDARGNIVRWYTTALDIDDRKRAEEVRLEERVRERTRIARELHDTLLQSFHGTLLHFQAASSLLPTRTAEAKRMLDRAIDMAAQAIAEGRDAIQGCAHPTSKSTTWQSL